MDDADKKDGKVQETKPNLFIEKLTAALGAMKAANEVKAAVPEPLDWSVMRPSPPAMLTPRVALLRLRAGTGCPIARETLYLWLKEGKIYAVRMGGRIYIPVEALDDFIRDWLTRGPLGRVL